MHRSETRSGRPCLSALLLASLALGAATGCNSLGDDRDKALTPGELVAKGRYQEALVLAAARVKDRPRDFEAAEQHRLVTAAWHLDQGRQAFQDDEDLESLEHLQAAHELAPEAPQPSAWIAKLHDKIAEEALDRGLKAHANDELEEAAAAYEQVLEMRPDDLRANELLALVLLTINYRQGLGSQYYRDGVRELSEYQLYKASANLGYAGKYLGIVERVESRGHQVDGLLAEQRIALAEGFESEGRWGAAKNEHRLALLLVPDHPGAKAGYERSVVEAQAEGLLDQAELLILKGRYDEALESIEAGAALTQVQAERFDGMRDAVNEARVAGRYQVAVDLASDYQFPEAIAAFDALLEDVEYYSDAIARRDTIQSYMDKAVQLYETAAAEADPEERLLLLREIELIWPEYRDTSEQLLELDPPGSSN